LATAIRKEKRRKIEENGFHLRKWSGRCSHHFPAHPVGQNAVIWSFMVVWEVEKLHMIGQLYVDMNPEVFCYQKKDGQNV
jgi:hypothetical protein